MNFGWNSGGQQTRLIIFDLMDEKYRKIGMSSPHACTTIIHMSNNFVKALIF